MLLSHWEVFIPSADDAISALDCLGVSYSFNVDHRDITSKDIIHSKHFLLDMTAIDFHMVIYSYNNMFHIFFCLF